MDSSKIKKGLGRGLSSLIGETKVETNINKLLISDLKRNKLQPRRIFDENSLSDAIERLIEWDDTDHSLIIKRWFKKIVRSRVTIHGGRFVVPNNNTENQPPNVNFLLYVPPHDWEQLISYPIQTLNLDNYNFILSEGASQWPENESISIYGLNINNMREQLPEIIEGINVLKKFFARTMNPPIRRTQIQTAGNKRSKGLRKLRWTYS